MNSTHTPTVEVPLRSGKIEIHELAWPDAMSLYKKLMAQSQSLLDEKGQLALDAQKLVSAIAENIELGTWLVLKCTRRDEKWLSERSLSEVLDVATEAATLNIGIIVDRIKNGGSRLRAIMAGANPTGNTKLGDSTANLPT